MMLFRSFPPLAFLLCCDFARAANATALPASPVSTTGGFIQIVLALGFVIALMLAAAWAFRKIGPVGAGNRIPMKVVAGVQVGNRERVMVVEVGDQWLIVGVTPNNISHLGNMPRQEISPQAATAANPFQDWLKKNLEKRQHSDASSE